MDFSKYAELILNKVLANENDIDFPLRSVDKICDIPCDVRINIELMKKDEDEDEDYDRIILRFIAEARHVCVHDDTPFRYLSNTQTCSVNLVAITKIVQELFVNILPNLVFNEMTSEMKVGVNSLAQMTDSILAEIKTITMHDKCSVCLVPTRRRPVCNHPLCVPCADKMLHNKNNAVPCPVCRVGHVGVTF